MKLRFALLSLLLLLCAGLLPDAASAADIPNIAAASDLKFALSEIAEAYTQTSGKRVNISYGSSGIFRRQIAEGAPFELYLSADEAYVDALRKDGRTEDGGAEDGGALYAIGRLVLYVPQGSPVKADTELRDVIAAAKDGRLKHLAIANPEHAPYGRAARETLQHVGAWDQLQRKLVLGENVAQAARFASSGSAEAALLPYSLAISPELSTHGTYVTLPESSYAPLKQRMVLIKGAGETARQFYRYLQQKEARTIFAKHGFVVPDH